MDDGRVYGEYQFHAAGTGRWSSRGVQVHNLKRLPDPKDFDPNKAIEVTLCGNHKKMSKAYPNPLATIGLLMRPLIMAPEGYELWGADFSGIEARVTAWLAGEESKLEVVRRFDRGEGPDPYIVAAAKIFGVDVKAITKEQRQVGKAAELAFGFQGGLGAFRKFSPANVSERGQAGGGRAGGGPRSAQGEGQRLGLVDKMTSDFTDEEIHDIKDKWRAAHPNICKMWFALNDAFWNCIKHPDIPYSVNRRIVLQYDLDSFLLPIVWLTLPSGRQLAYPDAKIRRPLPYEKQDENTGRGVYFKDNSSGRWFDTRMYGGLCCENVVQAVARDLLAEALKRLDTAGFKIVTHTHDEVVCEERLRSKRYKQFEAIMNMSPDWARGLPIIAKPWQDQRYVK
jgi:DNA polymerase